MFSWLDFKTACYSLIFLHKSKLVRIFMVSLHKHLLKSDHFFKHILKPLSLSETHINLNSQLIWLKAEFQDILGGCWCLIGFPSEYKRGFPAD